MPSLNLIFLENWYRFKWQYIYLDYEPIIKIINFKTIQRYHWYTEKFPLFYSALVTNAIEIYNIAWQGLIIIKKCCHITLIGKKNMILTLNDLYCSQISEMTRKNVYSPLTFGCCFPSSLVLRNSFHLVI